MNSIPTKIKNALAIDPFMKSCCINNALCEGKVEWHHVHIYAGRQIQEIWAIVPACKFHHSRAENPSVKRLFQRWSLVRATKGDLKKYPKKDWGQLKIYLKIKN